VTRLELRSRSLSARRGLRALAAGDLEAYLRIHAGDERTCNVNDRSDIVAEQRFIMGCFVAPDFEDADVDAA
jgi:hypothetical protein